MKQIPVLLAVSLLFVLNDSVAQTFDLFYYSGSLKISTGNVDKHPALGMKLNHQHAVVLGENSSAYLNDENGDFIVINGAGRFEYPDLIAEFEKQAKKSVLGTTLSYLKDKVLGHEPDVRDYTREHLKQKGGVSRGETGCSFPIMLYPGIDHNVLNAEEVEFRWEPQGDATTYELQLYKGEAYPDYQKLGEPLQVEGLSYSLDIKKLILDDNISQVLSWVAYPVSKPNCATYAFNLVSEKEIKGLRNSIENEVELLSDGKLRLLKRASLAESYGFLELASETYQKLIKEYPSKTYDEMFTLFLARNGLLTR